MANFDIQKSDKWLFGVILGSAIVGLLSSFILSVEKIHLLQDPNAVLSCSVNIWLNCASVMKTGQASVFGFPNSFIGLMAYSVIVTLAIGWFMGARYSRLFMFLAQIGAFLGLIFAYWLFFQSVFIIQVLCPWCLLVTVVTTFIFEALLRYNVLHENIILPKVMTTLFEKGYDKLLVASWFVIAIIMIYLQFKDYFTL